jgi:hypothetical protein
VFESAWLRLRPERLCRSAYFAYALIQLHFLDVVALGLALVRQQHLVSSCGNGDQA